MKNILIILCLSFVSLFTSSCGESSTTKKNVSPTLSLEENKIVKEHVQVNLIASANDSDGHISKISWQQISGPAVDLINSSTLNSYFIAPVVLTSQESQVVSFSLTVTDNDGGTSSETIDIEVQAVNEAPIANAGGDISSLVNEKVTVNCSNSYEPDGDEVSYHWQKSSTTPDDIVINNPNSCTAEILLTEHIVSFDLTLTVSDGTYSASDDVTINSRDYTGDKVTWSDYLNPSLSGSVQKLLSTDIMDIVIQEEVAYVLDNYGLQIIDISSPHAPVFIRSTTKHDEELLGWEGGEPRSIVLTGNTAYISTVNHIGMGAADSIQIRVIDVTNPITPKLIGMTYAGYGYSLDKIILIDDLLYVNIIAGDQYSLSSLVIIDVSTPTQPQQIGRFEAEGTFGSFSVEGDLVFITNSKKGLIVVDVTEKSKPVVHSEFSYSRMGAIITLNDVAYVGTSEGLAIIDISDPANPIIISELKATSYYRRMMLDNNKLYLASGVGIEVVDISDVLNPQLLGIYQPTQSIRTFYLQNNHVFIGSRSGLTLLEKGALSIHFEPTYLKTDSAKKVVVSNNKAYVIDRHNGISGGTNGSLKIIDTSDDLTPKLLSNLELSRHVNDIKLLGSTAIIADVNGVNFVDVTNSEIPIVTTTLAMGLNNTLSIATKNNYAYVGGDSDKYHLKIIDISDMSAPRLLRSVDLGLGDNRIKSIVIDNNYGYVISIDKISIIDISAPESPLLLNSIDIPNVVTLAVQNEIAFITDYTGSLTSIDFSDPLNSILLEQINIGKFYKTNGDDIAIDDNIAFVANGANGVTMFDISNPSAIELVGEFFSGHASSITYDDKFIYAAAARAYGSKSSSESGYVSLSRNLLINSEQNYNKVQLSSVIQYDVIGKDMLPLQFNCIVTAGNCAVNKIDDKMVIIWETPDLIGDHEIAIFSGNSRLYSAYKDKITLY